MKMSRLGFGAVHVTDTPTVARNIQRVLKSNRLSYGPFIQEFEHRLSRAHGCRFGVMVNSGTSALQIAVACLAEVGGWKPGDQVIVPAVTFVATSNVVLQQGFKPVFVDVDSRTYNMDPEKIERAITTRTRAIIPVHLFGQPADMTTICRIARKHRLKIIEDSCETMFASHNGARVGSFGDIACFSTYVAHLIVTGVGGMAVTNNPRIATVLRSLANHGRDGIYTSIDDDDRKRGKEFKQIVERRFRFIRNGYSYRVTELEGAVGCAQLDIAPKIIRARKRNATSLLRALKPVEARIQLPSHPSGTEHVFMMFPLVIRNGSGLKKKDLVLHLERSGIETRDMLPLVNQPFYRKMGASESRFPVARWINQNGFYVGCHQDMRKRELDFLANAIKDYVRTH